LGSHYIKFVSIIALSSPNNNISKDLYINIETTKIITSIIVGSNNTLHLAQPKLPTVQNIVFLAWFEFLAKYIKRFVIVPNIVEIAIPVKTNLVVDVDLPICVPIANTNTPQTIEPQMLQHL